MICRGVFVDIKLEIFAKVVSDAINSAIRDIHMETDDAINSMTLTVLHEIVRVVQNTEIKDDFDVVEKIVCILEKYNINAGDRHDF